MPRQLSETGLEFVFRSLVFIEVCYIYKQYLLWLKHHINKHVFHAVPHSTELVNDNKQIKHKTCTYDVKQWEAKISKVL